MSILKKRSYSGNENRSSKPTTFQDITTVIKTEEKRNDTIAKKEIEEGTKTPPPLDVHDDFLSPNANLKMLISVISPELRSRDSNDISEWADEYLDGRSQSQHSLNHEPLHKGGKKDFDSLYYIRSSKSLNLLCQKFLALYPEYPPILLTIQIDYVASQLSVERRRIYDIINILESLNMVKKLGKNKYEWHGKNFLLTCLKKLKELGIQNQSHSDKENRILFLNNNKENVDDNGNKNMNRLSLGILSQKFLMSLLAAKSQMMYMDDMAKIIDDEEVVDETKSCSDIDKKKPRTRVRRVYDIANVLSSLKLIEKIRVKTESGNKKPAFHYIGPDLSLSLTPLWSKLNNVKDQSPLNSRHSLFKHTSFSVLTPISTGKEKCDNMNIFNTPTSAATMLFMTRDGLPISTSKQHKVLSCRTNSLSSFNFYPTPGSGEGNIINTSLPWLTPISSCVNPVDSSLPLTPLTDMTPKKRKLNSMTTKLYTKRLFAPMHNFTTNIEVGAIDNDDCNKGTQTSMYASPIKGIGETQLLNWPSLNGCHGNACFVQPGGPAININNLVSVDDLKLLNPHIGGSINLKPAPPTPPSGPIPTLQFSMPSVLKFLNISPINMATPKSIQQIVSGCVPIKPKPLIGSNMDNEIKSSL